MGNLVTNIADEVSHWAVNYISTLRDICWLYFQLPFGRVRHSTLKGSSHWKKIILLQMMWVTMIKKKLRCIYLHVVMRECFKYTYELLNPRALKISKLYKNHMFQSMDKLFWVEFQRCPLKFHTKYLTHTLKDVHSTDILESMNNFFIVIQIQWKTDFNSLWPSDTIWRHKSGSTLAQVMACCLTAPSHYLNQCWHIIRKVQWHPSESNFTRDTPAISHWN